MRVCLKEVWDNDQPLDSVFLLSKAGKLKEAQAVLSLNIPELKMHVVKPSSIHVCWLSHEWCIRTVRKELPALIMTLQQLYETSSDAEAYGVQSIFSTLTRLAAIVLL